ncbi:MAG: T9SS type A sorting domain-containing protein [Bacteroidales bacterium]|nr:T9SS type A sorting domain-containing protein [Bacteroidales bacterium]
MKKLYFLVILLALCLGAFSQSSVNSSGGDFSGTNCNVSYSVGQVGYVAYENNLYVNEGIQQPYEIYDVTNYDSDITIRRSGGETLDISTEKIDILLSAYPNPTDDFLTLLVEGTDSEMEYSVYDISGKQISARKSFWGETSIDMSALPPATYFVRVTGDGRLLKTFKIVKK